MVKVSGVPYEVELKQKDGELKTLIDDIDSLIMELERENFMLRARTERLEDELRTSNELLAKLNIELINERNNNASRKP
jgi:predicted RNase H-like nuclease (RuvC/YqgF family)